MDGEGLTQGVEFRDWLISHWSSNFTSSLGVGPPNSPSEKLKKIFEPYHDKTNKMACVPSQDSAQPGHPPRLIGVYAGRTVILLVLS